VDDQTHIEPSTPTPPEAAVEPAASELAPAAPAETPAAGAETPAALAETPRAGAEAPAAGTSTYASSTSTTPVATGAGRLRWLLAIGLAGVALAAGLAVMFLFGSPPSTPEALQYIPSDAALVVELRMDLPGDQMQALGNLLAHFPGFQDQSTLPEKIDEALSRLVEKVPGSSTDYRTEIKPLLSGPTFIGVRSFEDMQTSGDPKNFVVIATTNGSASCGTTFEGQTLTNETYNGVELSLGGEGKAACAVDGRFFVVGDPAGVKSAIDAHKGGTGLDKSARYAAARAGLGLDRLATLYIDGVALGKAIPATTTTSPLGDLTAALPEWIIAGLRAESDAVVFDMVVAPPVAPSTPMPSMRTYPPVHPIALTALAPADSLVFIEAQGYTVGIHNLLLQLQADPQVAESLKMLDSVGGVNGLIGWIDDIGAVVIREGDAPAGAVFLVAHDAAAATEKVTALKTVLGLAALSGEIQVSESTVEGVTVTTIHIADISALLGSAVPGGSTAGIPPVAVDFAIAVKDRTVILGIGNGVMPKVLGVKAGATLADDAAFKRALTRSLPNPQSLFYVAAGSSLDWLQTVMAAQGAPAIPADVKAYIDPLDSVIISAAGDGTHGSTRFAITVASP
jgi:hypothetical protein